jgi:hypothetical protein
VQKRAPDIVKAFGKGLLEIHEVSETSVQKGEKESDNARALEEALLEIRKSFDTYMQTCKKSVG